MPTEEQKQRADAIERYVFFAAMIVPALAFVVQLMTKNKMLGIRIFVTALWVAFASANIATFYTGTFRWRKGPTFKREHSPGLFYASAIFVAMGSMSIATFLLWKAYTEE